MTEKTRSIICRQGSSRDRRLTRNWRRNREAPWLQTAPRSHLPIQRRKSKAARQRNRSCGERTPIRADMRSLPRTFRAGTVDQVAKECEFGLSSATMPEDDPRNHSNRYSLKMFDRMLAIKCPRSICRHTSGSEHYESGG